MTSVDHDIILLDKIARHLELSFGYVDNKSLDKRLFIFTCPQDFNNRVLFPSWGSIEFADPSVMLKWVPDEKHFVVIRSISDNQNIKRIDNPLFKMSRDEMQVFLDMNDML